MKTTIGIMDKKGSNAPSKILKVIRTINPKNSGNVELITPSKVVEVSDNLEMNNFCSSVAIGRTASNNKNQLSFSELKTNGFFFEGRIYSDEKVAGEIISAESYEEKIQSAKTFLKTVEGDYFFAFLDTEGMILGRDTIGVQPLFYGENEEIVGIASNRKVLWKIGIQEPVSFPPGSIGMFDKNRLTFNQINALSRQPEIKIDVSEASLNLMELLRKSVDVRTSDLDEVAVAFSGGLDSSVVAFLAKKRKMKVRLIHVSLEGQSETVVANRAAELLDLPLDSYKFTERDVSSLIPEVVEIIEEDNPTAVCIGIPLFWAAEKAAEKGYKAILAGQGADELFGGYQRYLNEYVDYGKDKVIETMYQDVVQIYQNNLERDVKICEFHDVELRLPFADQHLVRFALSLPLDLKFRKSVDSSRKLLLRMTAEKMGLDTFITKRPKKAIQYSTGVCKVVKGIAKKNNSTISEYVHDFYESIKR